MNPVRGKKPKVSASLAMPSWTSNGMKFRALLFGVAILFTLVPAAALATTTPVAKKPYCTLSASRSAVELGKTVNLSWQSQYATQGFITSIGAVGTNGMQGVIPTGSGTTYVGTFTGPGGTGNCSITISIIQPSGGGVGDVGTVPEPDRLPPSQSADAPTTLPPANEITLDKTPSKGLIPCSGLDCQTCHLASLAQRIINFLIGLSIPLAAAMFAYAGVIYFTSGVVDKIEKAHKIFKSVGIGFMIVLGAWLGIQTILKTILAPSYYASWNTIQCIGTGGRLGTDPNKPISINSLLSVLPGLNTNALTPTDQSSFNSNFNGGGSGPSGKCTGEGFYYMSDGGESNCFNPDTGEFMDPAYTYSNIGTGGCSQDALSSAWGSNAGAMSCIVPGESSCDPNALSSTDFTSDGNSFSAGFYQVNISAGKDKYGNVVSGDPHNLNFEACSQAAGWSGSLNCGSAFIGTNYKATVQDKQRYDACIVAAQNKACNEQAAQAIFQKQGFCAWGAAKNCNLGC